jgi:glycosyltransferase involved in cell wall biosynthesis
MPVHPFSLSVVIMAFNERESLPAQVAATRDFLRRTVRDPQIVLVDDGSTDGTAEVADSLAAADVDVYHHPRNRGMGAAVRTGYAAATREFVTQLPADGQVVPETLGRFLPHLPSRDLVLSTYTRRDDGLLRDLTTFGYRATAWALLGDPCAFTGTHVVRRSLLERVRLTSDSFLVNHELPLKLMRLGVVPAYVTIEAVPRAHGRSKVLSLPRIAALVREMVALRDEIVLHSPP